MSIKAIRIELPVEIHEFLVHVVNSYSHAGHPPEEGMVLFHLWDFVTRRGKVVDLEVARPPAPPESPVFGAPKPVPGQGPASIFGDDKPPVQVPNPPMDEDELGDR